MSWLMPCAQDLCQKGVAHFEVAVCCSVLQCVAVCSSVLQCVAANYLGCVLKIFARRVLLTFTWLCVAVCCSVAQCGAVWCSVVQCGAACCSVV